MDELARQIQEVTELLEQTKREQRLTLEATNSIQAQKENLEKEISSLENKKIAINKEISDFQEVLRSQQQMKNTDTEDLSKIEELVVVVRKQLDDLNYSKKELEKNLEEDDKKRIIQVEAELSSKDKEINSLKKIIKKLTNEKESLETTKGDLVVSIGVFEKERVNLVQNNESLLNLFNSLTRDISKAENSKEQLSGDNDRLSISILEKKNTISLLDEAIKAKTKKTNEQESVIAVLEEEIKKNDLHNSDLLKARAGVYKMKEDLEMRLGALKLKYQDLGEPWEE